MDEKLFKSGVSDGINDKNPKTSVVLMGLVGFEGKKVGHEKMNFTNNIAYWDFLFLSEFQFFN